MNSGTLETDGFRDLAKRASGMGMLDIAPEGRGDFELNLDYTERGLRKGTTATPRTSTPGCDPQEHRLTDARRSLQHVEGPVPPVRDSVSDC